MTKKKQIDGKTITEKLNDLLAEIPVPDLMIMAGGAYAGSMGYTPMTALLGGNAQVNKIVADMNQGVSALGLFGIQLAALGPIGWLGFLFVGRQISDEPVEQAQAEVIQTKVALAMIGMIEAYAITRPGVLPSLIEAAGSAVQGLGKGLGSGAIGLIP